MAREQFVDKASYVREIAPTGAFCFRPNNTLLIPQFNLRQTPKLTAALLDNWSGSPCTFVRRSPSVDDRKCFGSQCAVPVKSLLVHSTRLHNHDFSIASSLNRCKISYSDLRNPYSPEESFAHGAWVQYQSISQALSTVILRSECSIGR